MAGALCIRWLLLLVVFKIGVLGDLIVKLRICVVALFDIICCGGLEVVLCVLGVRFAAVGFGGLICWFVLLGVCVVGLVCWCLGALRIGLLVVLVVVGCGMTC